MLLRKGILLLLFVTISLMGCKKDNNSWLFCDGCTLDEWVGNYSGKGDYYSDSNGETQHETPITLTLENPSGRVIKTTVVVEDKFSTSFTTTKSDDDYFIEVPGSSKSLSLTLSKRDSEYKLSGTVKLFHYEKDTIVIDHSISFESFKE